MIYCIGCIHGEFERSTSFRRRIFCGYFFECLRKFDNKKSLEKMFRLYQRHCLQSTEYRQPRTEPTSYDVARASAQCRFLLCILCRGIGLLSSQALESKDGQDISLKSKQ